MTEKKITFAQRAAEGFSSIYQMTTLKRNNGDNNKSNNKASSCSAVLDNLHRFLWIKRAIIHFEGCTRRLFLFCDEKDIPDELILEVMQLCCNHATTNNFPDLELVTSFRLKFF
jgi:hypothetical protein